MYGVVQENCTILECVGAIILVLQSKFRERPMKVDMLSFSLKNNIICHKKLNSNEQTYEVI